ncbi:hypothetical protein G5B00_14680 [Parapedobacter sp. SGR-10]|uniref:hypothetical protein n=1 Tax=Parapedobacter sp. SGR-10 TaxID=2710879 RepID=UPI0013D5CC50|nr:hypothetical protein [Parapedobacter sp. SGR-10]NGF57762.1 hypothetical protein [Parapedobacter sp. SGR-10]
MWTALAHFTSIGRNSPATGGCVVGCPWLCSVRRRGMSYGDVRTKGSSCGAIELVDVRQDALKWASTLDTLVPPSIWPVWPRRRRGGAVAKR